MPSPTPDRPGGRLAFTLVELMIVIIIIGILVTFILRASLSSIQNAEMAATRALITKLETGMNDRLDAILTTRPNPSAGGFLIANIFVSGNPGTPFSTDPRSGAARAQTIALFELVKREMADTFFVPGSGPDASSDYPINFGAHPFPFFNGSPTSSATTNFLLPFGTAAPGVGAMGASFTVAAGIYKQAGYSPNGYDGLDNDGDGLIDEAGEGGGTAALATFMANHKPSTARAEMLYAILVEGQGPLGSVFTRDDFTTKEVQDTDGDGLLEFVDAWGQPLQYYRWPIFFQSDIQRGSDQRNLLGLPYGGVTDQRETHPLDPSRQLMAPAWWASTAPSGNASININSGPMSPFAPLGQASAGAMAFATYFHTLVDPAAKFTTATSAGFLWDFGNPATPDPYVSRRPFFSKFLIASSGPDKASGILSIADIMSANGATAPTVDLLQIEGNASQAIPSTSNVADSTSGDDDITNHNINSSGAGFAQ